MFPGNIGLSDKTIANWRTEIPALFGFYEEDKATNITKTSPLAFFLNDNQDLTQFSNFPANIPISRRTPQSRRECRINITGHKIQTGKIPT